MPTNYTHILPEGDIVLEGNDGTTYDVLTLDIDFRGDEPEVTLFVRTTSDGAIPVEVWDGRINRTTLATGEGVIDRDYLFDALDGGELAAAIDEVIAHRGKARDELQTPIEEWAYHHDIYLFDTSRSVWNAADYCYTDACERITAETTDEEILAYEAEIKEAAKADGVHLKEAGSLAAFLEELRDTRREEAA